MRISWRLSYSSLGWIGYFDRDAQSATSTVTLPSQPREGQEKGERRKEKGERRKEKGERRKEKGEEVDSRINDSNDE